MMGRILSWFGGLGAPMWAFYAIGILLIVIGIGLPSSYALGAWKGRTTAEAACVAEKSAMKKAVEYIVKYVDRVIIEKDEAQVKKLKSQLAHQRAVNKTLQQRIDEHAAKELPVVDSACALPDGLRNDLNAALRGDEALPDGAPGLLPEGDPVPADDGRQEGHE